MIQELSYQQVRNVCDPHIIGSDTTEAMRPLQGIIGQSRAMEAIRFGLGMPDMGFNIYVAGVPGTGKTTAVQAFLEEEAKGRPVPSDWCYVHNFEDPYRPKALRLPPGAGRRFQQDMRSLMDRARKDIRQAFESEDYNSRREQIQEQLGRQRQALFAEMSQRARREGFALQNTQIGLVLLPMKGDQPLAEAEFLTLEPARREEITHKREVLEEEFKAAFKEVRNLEKTAHDRVQEGDREVALYAVGHLMDEIVEKYRDVPEVVSHLNSVQEDLLANIDPFRNPDGEDQGKGLLPVPMLSQKDAAFKKYEVNVVVDNSRLAGAPVVTELNPTYNDLFGRIEKEATFGALHTDFTMIRAGSLHCANGGFLVVPALELLRNLFAWDGLKRAIRNREIGVEDMGERLGFVTTKSLRPEPIPLDLKVILIGNPMIYHLLYAADEDFNELFKIKADFDTRMDRTDDNTRDYLAFVCTFCRKEGLRHLEGAAAAKVVEHSSRLAGDQTKLSTRFAEISDLIREANYWANREGSRCVKATHIQKAVEAKVHRSDLVQERLAEMTARGVLLIDVDGEAVGQANGLAVISLGDYAFGRPNRITASVGVGRGGILDIEREAKLGGPLHTKGVLILSGFLVGRYAHTKPLSLAARLVFEQSYEGVEGDSASSTELYALLSALSGVPLRQDVAVTGSVNQHGVVQAIGGVNEKVEGFYEVCKLKGLTGKQGVLIPASNARDLMLKEEVVEAIREDRFHVWAVESVDEGIEVLTGLPAGQIGDDGAFPEGTVNHLVDLRFRSIAEALKEHEESGEEKRQRLEPSAEDDS